MNVPSKPKDLVIAALTFLVVAALLFGGLAGILGFTVRTFRWACGC